MVLEFVHFVNENLVALVTLELPNVVFAIFNFADLLGQFPSLATFLVDVVLME